jgi:hypothetical protein
MQVPLVSSEVQAKLTKKKCPFPSPFALVPPIESESFVVNNSITTPGKNTHLANICCSSLTHSPHHLLIRSLIHPSHPHTLSLNHIITKLLNYYYLSTREWLNRKEMPYACPFIISNNARKNTDSAVSNREREGKWYFACLFKDWK